MSSDSGPSNPDVVHTLPELAAALDRLRGSRSYSDLDRAVRPGRLARSTLNNVLNSKSVPTRDTVVTFLTACGLDKDAQKPWLAAWERVTTAHLRRPAGAVRVREARPRLLGVHAAIQVDPADNDLPPYVPRDLDADLRTAISVAAQHGGFVLLVGGSSVGKTRALYEAVRAVLPEWWLVHPADAEAVHAFAAVRTPRTVVWLDELQRYLDGPSGLPAGVVRSGIVAGTVLVATVWPHEYTSRIGAGVPGQPERHANDRQLLGLAHVIDVPDDFSAAERRRAEALCTDRRIRVALETADTGFTQILAAGPELVRRWENAHDAYGKAIITAALDARRVGATAPMTRDLLAAAAPGYLTTADQAEAPSDWVDHALAYATARLHRAASALIPISSGMGSVAGYTVADYLYQHARRVRRSAPLPDSAWLALVDHHHPDDTTRLAESADRRMRYHDAAALYRLAVDAADRSVRHQLALYRLTDLLTKQGNINEALTMLRAAVAAGKWYAREPLAHLLFKQGNSEELRIRADAGDQYAGARLADLLFGQGNTEELRARADAGDRYLDYVTKRLVDLLTEQGNTDEVLTILRTRADAGDQSATQRVVDLLIEQGKTDEVMVEVRTRAAAGDGHAAYRLSNLLFEQGKIEELRVRADAGDEWATQRLVDLLTEQGKTDKVMTVLRLHLARGAPSWFAHKKLVDMLAEQGNTDELRARADAGDQNAAIRLVYLLKGQGNIEEALAVLRACIDAGNKYAPVWLADLLSEQGNIDEALAVLRAPASAGNDDSAMHLANLLARQGNIDELQARADVGDRHAAELLAHLLARQGNVDQLQARADAGDRYAASLLVGQLTEQDNVDEAVTVLRARLDGGERDVAKQLVDLLANQGNVKELKAEVHAGTPGAAERFQEASATL